MELETAYLEQKGWIVKDGSAYLPEDTEHNFPYHIEGTYAIYRRVERQVAT